MTSSATAIVPPPSTLDRLNLVIDALLEQPRSTLTELSRRTGVPRTSVLRMLDHLIRLGWVRRIDRGYALGGRLADIGVITAYRDHLGRLVRPILQELHEVTGCVVHLGVLDGGHVTYTSKFGADAEPSMQTWPGCRVPASLSTLGRAVLSPATPATFGRCGGGISCIGVNVGTLNGSRVGLSVSGSGGRIGFDRLHIAPVRVAAVAIAQHFQIGRATPP